MRPALLIAPALLLLSNGSIPADPVADALAAVRDNHIEQFIRDSSVLGTLPGPAELAATQPQMRELFTAQEPPTIGLTPERLAEAARHYTHYTFHGPARSGPTPLGITGAYIREVVARPELVVTLIHPGTPAEGVLEIDDAILGANGRIFRHQRDPRVPMGYALYESTTGKLGGKLQLHLARKGKAMNVTIELPVSPPYSPTWPYDCERTEEIADTMVRFILDQGHFAKASRHGGGGYWAPLFLMASGEEEALEIVRRNLYRGLKDEYEPNPMSGHSWNSSYRLVTLCEYYLLTGDSNVLPAMRFYSRTLQNGQSFAGGWGHSCPCSGYGEVNATGSVALMGLALAREAGIELDPEKLAKSIRFFGRYIGCGMPYGNHNSGFQAGRGANGKAGQGALAFKFLGEKEASERWGRAVAYMWSTPEAGHAEGIFNMAWDPQAAAIGSPEEASMFMNNLLWYYEIARTHEGGMRFMRGGHFPYPVGQTTAVGLAYLLPRKQIYVTGASQSVFAMTPPNETLAGAAKLFRDKKWSQLKTALEAYLAKPEGAGEPYAKLLREAYQRMERHVAATLKLVETNLAQDNAHRARQQIADLERLLGEQRPEMTALLKKMGNRDESPRFEKHVKVEPTGRMFSYASEDQPTYDWEFILPYAEDSKESLQETYQVFRSDDPAAEPEGDWISPDYTPGNGWQKRQGKLLPERGQTIYLRRRFNLMAVPTGYKHLMMVADGARGEAYLNGYKIADFPEKELFLRPGSNKVLKLKGNVLAVRLTASGRDCDLAIKAGPPLLPDMKDLLDNF